MVEGIFKVGYLSALLVPVRSLLPTVGRFFTNRVALAGGMKQVLKKNLLNPVDLGLNSFVAFGTTRPPKNIRIYE